MSKYLFVTIPRSEFRELNLSIGSTYPSNLTTETICHQPIYDSDSVIIVLEDFQTQLKIVDTIFENDYSDWEKLLEYDSDRQFNAIYIFAWRHLSPEVYYKIRDEYIKHNRWKSTYRCLITNAFYRFPETIRKQIVRDNLTKVKDETLILNILNTRYPSNIQQKESQKLIKYLVNNCNDINKLIKLYKICIPHEYNLKQFHPVCYLSQKMYWKLVNKIIKLDSTKRRSLTLLNFKTVPEYQKLFKKIEKQIIKHGSLQAQLNFVLNYNTKYVNQIKNNILEKDSIGKYILRLYDKLPQIFTTEDILRIIDSKKLSEKIVKELKNLLELKYVNYD